MMKAKHQRLLWISVAGVLLVLSATLILSAFDDNLVFFYSPTDLQSKTTHPDQRIRVGGLVLEGSLDRNGTQVSFTISDQMNFLPIHYEGMLPDLFREGQGVVVEGHLQNGQFMAQSVLAKHDENYMPPEVAKTLKEQGVWRHAE